AILLPFHFFTVCLLGSISFCPLTRKTAERIARENNTTERTVRRSEKFALGVEAAEDVLPGTRHEILSGKICPIDSAVQAVAQAPPEEREALANHLRDPEVQRRGRHRTETEEERIARKVEADMNATASTRSLDESGMLETLRGVADTMISSCNRCFDLFPALLTELDYRRQVIDIMQEPKIYILNLETGTGGNTQ
ncbi:MAG: hypothetical protein LUG45_02405, partial [Clostridiales bacterium]|nr:hypothetical protein [Clostridiales bacterium]